MTEQEKSSETTTPTAAPAKDLSNGLTSVRIDKWLFATRFYKTRSEAAKAIAGGKIKVEGHNVKAHRPVKIGEEIEFKRDGRTHHVRVKGLLERRVGAKVALEYYELTLDADLDETTREMMEAVRKIEKQAPRMRGRPTKRDRRQIQKFKEKGFD